MNIAVLHSQCRVRGGAIQMALLTAQLLQKQGHHVIFYTFEHDAGCFPELQEGLTIVTGKTTKENKAGTAPVILNSIQDPGKKASIPPKETKGDDLDSVSSTEGQKSKLDTVDKPRSFWGLFHISFPRLSSIIGIAWDIRQVDIVIAHDTPMQVVGALAKIFSIFSTYHQRLVVIWWHHHIPRYYISNSRVQSTKYKVIHFFSLVFWKSLFERNFIIPRIKYMIATSYYAAFCIEKYCGRKSTVIHPVIMDNEEIQKASATADTRQEGGIISSDNQLNEQNPQNKGNDARPVVLFFHGHLEPGKGLDTLVKVWKELNKNREIEQKLGEQNSQSRSRRKEFVDVDNPALNSSSTDAPNSSDAIKLVIAGYGSLKNWLTEQGATVITYHDGLLDDIKKTQNDILALYLSTVDACNVEAIEAQIAGLETIILDKGGARETVLLDNNKQPMAQLIDTENEIIPAITYFIQQRSLHKRVSNVNFCHQREYFTLSRLDADIRSLIDSVR